MTIYLEQIFTIHRVRIVCAHVCVCVCASIMIKLKIGVTQDATHPNHHSNGCVSTPDRRRDGFHAGSVHHSDHRLWVA